MAAPRVCFFGRAREGSWRIRAEQLAAARGAWTAVSGELPPDALLRHDVFVIVKRPDPRKQALLRALGKTVVLDVLDFWAQPDDDLRVTTIEQARRLFADLLRAAPVDAVVFPNRAMKDDLGDLAPRATTLYHHFRPGLTPGEVRPRARAVGYEGEERYLGPWRAVLERACAARGLRFVVNPPDLGALDLGVSVRGGSHAGLLSKCYKSNVKLANWIGAGIPALCAADEASYAETAPPGGVRFFATPADLEAGLDALLPEAARREARAALLSVRDRFRLETIAAEYEAWLADLVRRPAVGA